MHAMLISLVLLGRSRCPACGDTAPCWSLLRHLHPQPPAAADSKAPSVEEMKTWLLTRLTVDLSYDAQKSAQLQRMINSLNEQELKVLIAVYQERSGKKDALVKTPLQALTQQRLLDPRGVEPATSRSLPRSPEAQHELEVLQEDDDAGNLFYQNMVNNQRFMSRLRSMVQSLWNSANGICRGRIWGDEHWLLWIWDPRLWKPRVVRQPVLRWNRFFNRGQVNRL